MFIKKKDGSLCLCVDFRKLNAMTIPWNHGLPSVNTLIDLLKDVKFFTKLDLWWGYNDCERQ